VEANRKEGCCSRLYFLQVFCPGRSPFVLDRNNKQEENIAPGFPVTTAFTKISYLYSLGSASLFPWCLVAILFTARAVAAAQLLRLRAQTPHG